MLGLDLVYRWFLSKGLKKRGTKQVVIKQEAYYDSIHLTVLENRTFLGIYINPPPISVPTSLHPDE